jgi:hypothetical protein
MANRSFTRSFYTLHNMPTLIDCNFTIDKGNGNGLGIRNLKGAGVAAVYGNTTATPATNNPNPPPGYFYILFQDNYYRYFGSFSGFANSVGTPGASTTANAVSVITSLGTATTAQWRAVGLPVGVTPAVGVSFVATASGTVGGSATVAPPSTNGTGITSLEVVGDPNTTLNTYGAGSGSPYIIIRTMGPTGAGTTTPIATAPTDNSIFALSFYLSNSSVIVSGE